MRSQLSSLLERALASVDETPSCGQALRESLAVTVVTIQIDDECCWLRGDVNRLDVLGSRPALIGDAVSVVMRGAVLMDLLDCRAELLTALRTNALRVRGSPGAVARAFAALKYFVEGCARSSKGTQLLLEFRQSLARGIND